MKKFLKHLVVLIGSGAGPISAADDFYVDYTEKVPVGIVQPAADENEPAFQKWQIRFADACALIMDREEKTQAEARKILYALLDERPDSKEVLDLLDFVLKINPRAKKEVVENICSLVKKHVSSINLNMFLLKYASLSSLSTDFLKNALKLCTDNPEAVQKIPNGNAHACQVIMVSALFCMDYPDPEIASAMYRCYKTRDWFKEMDTNRLRLMTQIIQTLLVYPEFQPAQCKAEIIFIARDLRERFLELILNDGLDKITDPDEYSQCVELCMNLIAPPYSDYMAKLEQALKEKPGVGKTEILVYLYYANKRYKDALTLIRTYLEKEQKKEPRMIELGCEVLLQAELWDELFAFSEEYFKYLPEKKAIQLRLDIVRDLLENYDYVRAADVLKHLKSFQSLSGRIQLLARAKKFEEAYKILKEQAIPRFVAGERSANLQQDYAFLEVGSFLVDLYKDFDSAEKLYLTWLKDHPQEALILNNLAYSYAMYNVKLDEAFKMSAAALRADPENAAYLDTMAWILYRQKKYSDAALYIEEALAASSKSEMENMENMEILEHAGDIYVALGNKEKAKQYWTRAIDALKKLALETKVKNEAEVKRIQEKLDKLKDIPAK